MTSPTQSYFHVNFLTPVDLRIVNLEYDIRFNMRLKLCSGNLLHFLIKLRNNLLTANWWQVCFSVDSCISDMDHRETVVFMLELLEHLIRFQDLIQMGCLLSFHQIKGKECYGAVFILHKNYSLKHSLKNLVHVWKKKKIIKKYSAKYC